MSATAILAFIKSLWKVPEGRLIATILMVVIGGLLGGGWFAVNGWISANAAVIDLQKEKGEIRREHGTEMLHMQQRCDSEKEVMRNVEIAELKERIAEKERVVDEALTNADRILHTQHKAKKNVSTALKAVAK